MYQHLFWTLVGFIKGLYLFWGVTLDYIVTQDPIVQEISPVWKLKQNID